MEGTQLFVPFASAIVKNKENSSFLHYWILKTKSKKEGGLREMSSLLVQCKYP